MTDRQTETNGQTDRNTDREASTHAHINTHTHHDYNNDSFCNNNSYNNILLRKCFLVVLLSKEFVRGTSAGSLPSFRRGVHRKHYPL